MGIFDKLSKREKYLIYVLTILLIIFAYINLVRDPINNNRDLINEYCYDSEVYFSLINERDQLKNDIDSINNKMNRYNVTIDEFGNFIKLDELLLEENLKSQVISRVNKIDNIESDIFYIESISEIETKLEEIPKLLDYISNKNLHIENLLVKRRDVNNFTIKVTLREYTTSSIPFTGIVTTTDFREDKIENENLLDELYGEKKNEEVIESVYSNTTSQSTSNSNTKSTEKSSYQEKEVPERTVVDEVIEKDFTKFDELISDIILIENNLLNKKYIFSSDYLNDNKEILNNTEFIESLIVENDEQILLLTKDLIFEDAFPKLINSDNYYSFQFSGDLGTRLKFIFKDSLGEYHKFEIVKQYDDFQSVEFSLEYLKELFPLELVKIEKSGDSDVPIKEFIIYSE